MGIFETDNDDLLGGLLDLDGDGKTSLDEEFMGYLMAEELLKTAAGTDEEEDTDTAVYEPEADLSDVVLEDTSWRYGCTVGPEFFIDPNDYSSLDDYLLALETEFESQTDNNFYFLPVQCSSESEYVDQVNDEIELETGLDIIDYINQEDYFEAVREYFENKDVVEEDLEEEDYYEEVSEEEEVDEITGIRRADYPNRRQYEAAVVLKRGKWIYLDGETREDEIERCKFILKKHDKVIAANYMVHYGQFLYAQAIKENFDVSCDLPDEDRAPQMGLYDIFYALAEEDFARSLKIWKWCLKEFFPYAQKYDDCFRGQDIIKRVLSVYSFPDDNDYRSKFIEYLSKDDELYNFIFDNADERPAVRYLIEKAVELGETEFAEKLFESGLKFGSEDWEDSDLSRMLNR